MVDDKEAAADSAVHHRPDEQKLAADKAQPVCRIPRILLTRSFGALPARSLLVAMRTSAANGRFWSITHPPFPDSPPGFLVRQLSAATAKETTPTIVDALSICVSSGASTEEAESERACRRGRERRRRASLVVSFRTLHASALQKRGIVVDSSSPDSAARPTFSSPTPSGLLALETYESQAQEARGCGCGDVPSLYTLKQFVVHFGRTSFGRGGA